MTPLEQQASHSTPDSLVHDPQHRLLAVRVDEGAVVEVVGVHSLRDEVRRVESHPGGVDVTEAVAAAAAVAVLREEDLLPVGRRVLLEEQSQPDDVARLQGRAQRAPLLRVEVHLRLHREGFA